MPRAPSVAGGFARMVGRLPRPLDLTELAALRGDVDIAELNHPRHIAFYRGRERNRAAGKIDVFDAP